MRDPVAELIADLTYQTYAYNRGRSPDITPESWKAIFVGDDVDAFEARYQAEKVNAYAEAGIRKDQRAHHEGRSDDFGVSACGRSDRAGS